MTVIDVLRARAKAQPDARAFTFLVDGENEEDTLTFGELDRRARSIAAHLQATHEVGSRAVLLFSPGLRYVEAFMGALYAGMIAVPAYPPDPTRLERTLERLHGIVEDCDAVVLLTEPMIADVAKAMGSIAASLAARPWVPTDSITANPDDWTEPTVTAESLAFLQYTSGSTGTPKGVMLSHDNLVRNEQMITDAYQMTSRDVIVSWLPLYHDMGLIGAVLAGIYNGCSTVLMSPLHFLQKPLRWLQAISKYRGTYCGGPNFAFDLCVRKVTPEEREHLDLSSWRLAPNGAEPIPADSIGRFAEEFASCGFPATAMRPAYGLAEATLLVSVTQAGGARIEAVDADALRDGVVREPHGDAPAAAVVACGPPSAQQVVIVDPETRVPVGRGRVGEIWVQGPHVARGYWRQPEKSDATFRARLVSGEGPYLRTGDLGYLDEDVFVTGRIKDMIIVRGCNYYPQDIERTAEDAHPSIRRGCCAAFAVTIDGEERLVLLAEFERRYRKADRRQASGVWLQRRSGKERREPTADPSVGADSPEPVPLDNALVAVRAQIAAVHGIPVHALLLLKARSIHKTSSGKIQRDACRRSFLAGSLDVLARTTGTVDEGGDDHGRIAAGSLTGATPEVIAAMLRQRIAAVLAIPAQAVDRSPLAELGLDSLQALELHDELENALEVELPPTVILRADSLAALAEEVSTAPRSVRVAVGSESSSLAPSLAQESILEWESGGAPSATWNVLGAVRVQGSLDVEALQRALTAAVARHDALRYSFPEWRVAKLLAPFEVDLEVETIAGGPHSLLEAERRAAAYADVPFDVKNGPLLRARLFRVTDTDHLLAVVIHHSTFDGASSPILLREIADQYAIAKGHEQALAKAESYVAWARQQMTRWREPSTERERHIAWWAEHLECARPPIRRRSGARALEAHRANLHLDSATVAALTLVARKHGATPFMVVLSSVKALLAGGSGPRLVASAPTANRGGARELRKTIGQFTDSVIVCSEISSARTFADVLREVTRSTCEAFDHAKLPARFVLGTANPLGDPRAQLRVNVRTASAGEITPLRRGEVTFTAVAVPMRAYREFDMHLTLVRVGAEMVGSLRTAQDLYSEPETEALAVRWSRLLAAAVRDPGLTLERT